MTGKDFRDAFPPMDEGFRCAVLHALEDAGKERAIVKRKLSLGAVLAAAIVMMAAAAAAAVLTGWGVMDFLQGKSLPEAGEMVTKIEGASAQTELADFTVREAFYDGYGVYLTVNVRARDEAALPLPGGVSKTDPVSKLNVDGDMTIEAYAASMGKTRFISVSVAQGDGIVDEDAVLGFSVGRRRLEEDGSLTLLFSALRSAEGRGGESIALNLRCGADTVDLTDTDLWLFEEGVEKAGITVRLTRSDSIRSTKVGSGEWVCNALDVTIHQIRLIRTPLTVYYEIDVTYTGKTRQPPIFRVKTDGTVSMSDVALVTVYSPVDRASGVYHVRGTMAAVETLPDEIGLEVSLRDGSTLLGKELLTIPLQ